MLDLAVLGLLRRGPRHGYDLRRQLAELGFVKVSFGALYPALRRLEREGVLGSAWEPAPGSGPRRRVYALTPGGEATARAADERLREARRFLAGELRPDWVGPSNEGGR